MVIKKIPETLVFAPFSVRLKRVECKDGPEDNPFDTLAEGLGAAPTSTTVKIKSDTGTPISPETMTFDQAVTIEAVNGAVRIGDSAGRNSKNGRQSGFVSRN